MNEQHPCVRVEPDTTPQADTGRTLPPDQAAELDRGLSAVFADDAPCRGRFVLDGDEPRGKGGMGRVWLAHDDQLGRSVALKEMLPDLLGHEEARRRFLLEAQVTSQLQHPGIVPVYEMVAAADDTGPFYTMRFVEGRSLSEAIMAFHLNQQGKTRPDRVELRDLLGAFVVVCNTLAYAHSRGVVHRDLKPDNVRLGAYGEVVVLDWGLALVGGSGAGGGEMVSVDDPVLSRPAGGTPAYMAPEQVEGRTDAMDARIDVFALGGMLYAILAGRAPYSGPLPEVLEKARRGAVSPVRTHARWVDKALAAVCMKALQPCPQDRYQNAIELAEEVRRFLADEPVQAWPEPLWKRASRWIKRHRTLTTALGVAVLVTLAALGWIAHETQQRDEQRRQQAQHRDQEAQRWLQEAQGFDGAARGLSPELAMARVSQALTKVENAATLLAEGGEDPEILQNVETYRAYLRQRKRDLEMISLLKNARELPNLNHKGELDVGAVGLGYRSALAWYLDCKDILAMPEQETLTRLETSAIREELLPALNDLGMIAPTAAERERANRLVEQLDPDPIRRVIRATRKKKASLRDLVRLAQAENLAKEPVATLSMLGGALAGQGAWSEAERVFRLAWNKAPGDFGVNLDLGTCLLRKDARSEEAVRFLTAAVAASPTSPAVRNNLGVLFASRNKWKEAEEAYRAAIELKPSFAMAHSNLGALLKRQGKFQEAEASYRTAIRHQPNYALTHYNLGLLLEKLPNRKAEALECYLAAVKHDPEFQEAYRDLARLQALEGQFEAALVSLKRVSALTPPLHPMQLAVGLAIRETQNLLERDQRFTQVLSGTATPTDALERTRLASWAQEPFKARYLDAARLYTEAFQMLPDLQRQHRHDAACAAARAGCGMGKGSDQLSPAQREYWRRQALGWLREEIQSLKQANTTAARKRLEQMSQAPELACVREKAALARLSETERQEWARFWEELAAAQRAKD